MTKEEFFKRFAENAGAGRVSQRVEILKTDMSDGILHRESQSTNLHNESLVTFSVVERAVLACGHRGEVGLLCRHTDENSPEPHYVCPDCMTRCRGCQASICAHHAVEADRGRLCPDCAQTAWWDEFSGRALNWVGRLLE